MTSTRARACVAAAPAGGAADLLPPAPPGLRWALAAQVLAALGWAAQAALIAAWVGVLARALPPLGAAPDAAQAAALWSQALWTAGGVLALALGRASLDAWGTRRIWRAARTRVGTLRERLARRVAAQSPLDKRRAASGRVASTVAEQAEALLPWLTRYQSAQARVLVVPPLLLALVAWQSWAAAAVLALAAPLIPLFMALIGLRAQSLAEDQMQSLGALNGDLLDRLRGMRTLRSMGAVPAAAARLHASGATLAQRSLAVLRVAFLSSAVLELFSALGVAMVAVYVGFHLLGELPFGAWGGRLDLAQGLFVLLLAPAFFEPLRDLSAAWHDRASGRAALAQAQDLVPDDALALVQALPGAIETEVPGCRPMAVELHALRFAHPGQAPLFDGLSLAIAPGAQVALTGASGRGKSVLLALLAGLLTPQGGAVRLDGQVLAPHNVARLRARIGWLGQHPHVFAAPVADNITLGRDAIDPVALRRTLVDTGLAAVIDAMPRHGLGEGGSGLSGGEVLRLALARLAATPGAGLLLADEPTAHLDAETATQVADALLRLARGRTLLVATHDPALVARLPQRIDLDALPGVAR